MRKRNNNKLQRILQQQWRRLLQSLPGKSSGNSDLRSHRFTLTAEPGKKKRRLSIQALRDRLGLRHTQKKENYSPSRREVRSWKRYMYIGAALSAGAIFFLANGPNTVAAMFADLAFFKVRNITISGGESSSIQRLRGLSGLTLYRSSLLNLDKEAVAAAVTKDPWVSKAIVRRDWPSTVIIEVDEHRPLALLNLEKDGHAELHYIDADGISFVQIEPGQDIDYPVITGLGQITDKHQQSEIFKEIRLFLKRVSRNNPNLPAQSISEVHVKANGEMVIYLVEHPFPIFFGRGEVATKYFRLVKVLESLYKEKKDGMLFSGVEYIRMDYLNDKVLVAQGKSG